MTFSSNNDGLNSCDHAGSDQSLITDWDHAASSAPKPWLALRNRVLPRQKGFSPDSSDYLTRELTSSSSSWVPLRHHAQNPSNQLFVNKLLDKNKTGTKDVRKHDVYKCIFGGFFCLFVFTGSRPIKSVCTGMTIGRWIFPVTENSFVHKMWAWWEAQLLKKAFRQSKAWGWYLQINHTRGKKVKVKWSIYLKLAMVVFIALQLEQFNLHICSWNAGFVSHHLDLLSST